MIIRKHFPFSISLNDIRCGSERVCVCVSALFVTSVRYVPSELCDRMRNWTGDANLFRYSFTKREKREQKLIKKNARRQKGN